MTSMSGTRRLMQGEVTYSWAKEKETNILVALERPIKTDNFLSHLRQSSILIRQAAAHHLGVSADECAIDDEKNWFCGSFNVCIPIIVGTRRFLMRFPQLHIRGWRRSAHQFLFRNFMDLRYLQVKVYEMN